MNIDTFVWACQSRDPVAIVLTEEDFAQLERALPNQPGEWNRQDMRFRGAPIVRGRFHHSYIVEDTPDGPLCHMVS